MLKVEFNAAEARATLAKAKASLSDLTELHSEIREHMLESTRARFISGTAPDGSRWARKAESTIAYYERRGIGGLAKLRTLYKFGALSNDLIGRHDKNGVVIGSNLKYAAVMQEGAAQGAFGRDRRGHPFHGAPSLRAVGWAYRPRMNVTSSRWPKGT
jgi:phage gpG-like protein